MLGLTGLIGAFGCAPAQGWSVSEARTCAPADAARVCVVAEPDHGHVVSVADVALLPGECAHAPASTRGGLAAVETRARDGQTRQRWVSTPRGVATVLAVDAEGKLDAARQVCDQTPISVDASSRRASSARSGPASRRRR